MFIIVDKKQEAHFCYNKWNDDFLKFYPDRPLSIFYCDGDLQEKITHSVNVLGFGITCKNDGSIIGHSEKDGDVQIGTADPVSWPYNDDGKFVGFLKIEKKDDTKPISASKGKTKKTKK